MSKTPPNKFSPSKEDSDFIVKSYLENTLTVTELASKFSISRPSIYAHLKRCDVAVVNDSSLNKFKMGFTINRDCFSDFSREPDAYFYGLLNADGYLTSSGNYVTLALSKEDSKVIQDYKNWLGLNNKITISHSQRNLNGKPTEMHICKFADKVIRRNLESQGMKPKKSLSEVLPNFYYTNPESRRHFWRGMIDGDGSVKIYSSTTISLVGSSEITEGFCKFAHEECSTKLKSPRKHSGTDSLMFADFSGEDARKLAVVLYDNCNYFMDRKSSVAKSFKAVTERLKFKRCGTPRELTGISFNGKKWLAYIAHKSHSVYVGTFSTKDEAVDSRKEFLDLYKELQECH